jgi:hypothetical protein
VKQQQTRADEQQEQVYHEHGDKPRASQHSTAAAHDKDSLAGKEEGAAERTQHAESKPRSGNRSELQRRQVASKQKRSEMAGSSEQSVGSVPGQTSSTVQDGAVGELACESMMHEDSLMVRPDGHAAACAAEQHDRSSLEGKRAGLQSDIAVLEQISRDDQLRGWHCTALQKALDNKRQELRSLLEG